MDNVAETVQRLINRPASGELAVVFGISMSLLLLAAVVLLATRRRWTGLSVGVLGLMGAMAVLLLLEFQTVTFRESESVTVTRPRYREKTRTMARGGMVALPCLVVAAGLAAWGSARRRIRKSVPILMKTGRKHLFHGEYQDALECFSRAIRIAPLLSEAYSGRAAALQGLGDVAHALADYDEAIRIDPRLAHALIQRARIHTEAGEPDRALVDLIRVMEIQPNDPELYLNRGICYYKKGQIEEATSDLHRVLKLTNHTDFAEPAKELLRQIEGTLPGLPFETARPSPESNGLPQATTTNEPKTEDQTA